MNLESIFIIAGVVVGLLIFIGLIMAVSYTHLTLPTIA